MSEYHFTAPWDWKEQNNHRGGPVTKGGFRANDNRVSLTVNLVIQADFEVPVPILVCTYTNMALDHIVEGLVGRGLKPLRVGLEAKVQPALKDYTLEAYLDRHPRRNDLERLVREETRLQEKARLVEKNIGENSNKPARLGSLRAILANVDRQLWVVKAKVFRLRQEMITDVLKQADVVGWFVDLRSQLC